MDDQLLALIQTDRKATVRMDYGKGVVELLDKGNPTKKQEYSLKPMEELYGKGTGLPSVELTDNGFFPLLLAIEETFVNEYEDNPSLTDGSVILSLDTLSMSPEADVSKDRLAALLQFRLRFVLSINEYSRQDVKLAMRKIKQSVKRHNKMGGTRGYLQFITQMLRHTGRTKD